MIYSTTIFRTLGLSLIALTLFSCKKEVVESDKELIKVADSIAAMPQESVYLHRQNKNEFTLRFVRNGDAVTGTFNYHLNGRDKNDGTIKGEFVGDLLIADYVFSSEGTTSTRQVVFKKSGNSLLEGYGDVEEVAGKVVFKDVNLLEYNPAFKLDLIQD
ncbi:hypothetical protein [Flavobacterium sp. JP2137]|uniref:hypothetical protein n=1 Tax=Flavobacterium sp. JP2137 TaxID=3414510 RepID=UPI003D2FB283